LKDLNFLVPPELGARGRIGVDFASFETCVYTVAQERGNKKKLFLPFSCGRRGWGMRAGST